MNPSEWWELYGNHVPLLQSVAQRVLAQPGSAFAAERNWSIYGQVKGEKRLRLTHGNADSRVYCHEAIQLHEKLLAARDAYSANNVLEWTDSDSDHSECDSQASDTSETQKEIEKLMR